MERLRRLQQQVRYPLQPYNQQTVPLWERLWDGGKSRLGDEEHDSDDE